MNKKGHFEIDELSAYADFLNEHKFDKVYAMNSFLKKYSRLESPREYTVRVSVSTSIVRSESMLSRPLSPSRARLDTEICSIAPPPSRSVPPCAKNTQQGKTSHKPSNMFAYYTQ